MTLPSPIWSELHIKDMWISRHVASVEEPTFHPLQRLIVDSIRNARYNEANDTITQVASYFQDIKDLSVIEYYSNRPLDIFKNSCVAGINSLSLTRSYMGPAPYKTLLSLTNLCNIRNIVIDLKLS